MLKLRLTLEGMEELADRLLSCKEITDESIESLYEGCPDAALLLLTALQGRLERLYGGAAQFFRVL